MPERPSDAELSTAPAKGELSCTASEAGEPLSVPEALTVLESAGVVASSKLKVLGLVLVGLGRHVPARADGSGILKASLLSKMFHASIARAYVSSRAAVYSSADKPVAIIKDFPVASSCLVFVALPLLINLKITCQELRSGHHTTFPGWLGVDLSM